MNFFVPVPLELKPLFLARLRVRFVHLSSNIDSLVRCDNNLLHSLLLVRWLILYYEFFLDPLLSILILFFSLVDDQSVFLLANYSYLFIIQHLHSWYLAFYREAFFNKKGLIFLNNENLTNLVFFAIQYEVGIFCENQRLLRNQWKFA